MGKMKIIVRVPNWVGDCVLAVPALRSLRRGFPRAEVWVAAKPGTRDLFAVDGLADGIVNLPEDNSWRGFRQASRQVAEGSFDSGLLLTNSFGSALLFYLSRIPERWGYASDGRSLLLTKTVRQPKSDLPRHHVHYYLDLLDGIGVAAHSPELKLNLPPEDLRKAADRLKRLGLDLSRPVITLCPGASSGPAKRWPAERFARAAAMLRERRGAEVLVIGSPAETDIAEAVRTQMSGHAHVLTGRTSLRELMGVLACSTLLISNDTGPLHLANALGVPVVGIFGPTDPAVTGPFAPPSLVVKKDVPCWPCYYRRCPLDHRCLTLITPAEVAAAESLWP